MIPGGVAQPGRALPSHGRSRRFKSDHLHPPKPLVDRGFRRVRVVLSTKARVPIGVPIRLVITHPLSDGSPTMAGMSTETTTADRHLEEIHKRHDRLLDLYDRTILSLSGGAIVLSVTFMGGLVDRDPADKWLLGWAWGLLIASVLGIAFSYIPSVISHEAVWSHNERSERVWGNVAWYASLGAGICFAVGLMFLARFAFVNM